MGGGGVGGGGGGGGGGGSHDAIVRDLAATVRERIFTRLASDGTRTHII